MTTCHTLRYVQPVNYTKKAIMLRSVLTESEVSELRQICRCLSSQNEILEWFRTNPDAAERVRLKGFELNYFVSVIEASFFLENRRD